MTATTPSPTTGHAVDLATAAAPAHQQPASVGPPPLTDGVATPRAALAGMVAVASGSMVLFPLFPQIQLSLGISTTALGGVAAAGFVAALLAEMVLAPQADRGHARFMATTGVLLVAASLVVMAFSTTAWQLIGARAVTGLGVGLFLPAASAVLIRRAPARAGESLGKLSTADLGGIALGPLVAALLLQIMDVRSVLLVSAGAVLVMAVPVARWLREPTRTKTHLPLDDHPAQEAGISGPPPALAFDLLRHRRVWGAALLTVAVMIPVGAYDALWPRFMTDIGAGEVLIGASYVLFAVPFMLLAAPAGRLADRIGGAGAFWRGLLLLVAMIVLYAVVTDAYAVTAIGMVESSGQALAFVGAAAAMAQATSSERAGAAQGLARGLGLVGAAAASAVAGWAYVVGGPELLFGATAIVTLLAAALGLRLLRSRQDTTDSRKAVQP